MAVFGHHFRSVQETLEERNYILSTVVFMLVNGLHQQLACT